MITIFSVINDFNLNNQNHKIDIYKIPIGKTQVESIKIIDPKNILSNTIERAAAQVHD